MAAALPKERVGGRGKEGGRGPRRGGGGRRAAPGAKKSCMVVAAIDFGTTYSGCAYSFREEWERDPLKIYSQNFLTRPDLASDGTQSQSTVSAELLDKSIAARQTEKVPTTILFDSDKKFVAFGYEAENIYSKLHQDDPKKAKTWYYFSQFKMDLHSKPDLRRDHELKDFTLKKGLPAIKVFSEAIRFLRNHVLRASRDIQEEDVEWVLTVPAIWTDKARQFMREAAREAGIPDERLSLALEPEAASVLCLEEDRRQGHLNIHQPGSRFMVVDNGGGTVDITVYEVVRPKKPVFPSQQKHSVEGGSPRQTKAPNVKGILKELYRPTGGPCAGKQVDKAFKEFLTRITSFDAIASLEKVETLEIQREYEDVKKVYHTDEYVYIKIPDSGKDAMEEALSEKPQAIKDNVSFVKNRMKIKKSTFEGLFEETIKTVGTYVEGVLKQVGKVGTILLVGGFSDCLLLQESIKGRFHDIKVLIPPNPGAAVLKGAVLFRNDPSVIGWRASAFTYGIEADEPFIQGRHKEEKAHWEDGVKKSRDVFARFIRVDDIVEVDQLAKSEIFLPCQYMQQKLILPVFKSTAVDPIHTTDEGCEKLGEVTVQLKNVTNPDETDILVEMYVGGTELIVRARNPQTGEEYSAVCDFLCK